MMKGLGRVLGQDGQQVLNKYGANYVRLHPCRITLDCNPITTTKQPPKENNKTNNENESSSSKIKQTVSNSDSDHFDSTHLNFLQKRTGIYPNAWNAKFQDDTIKSVDFDRKVQRHNPKPIEIINKQTQLVRSQI